MQIKYNIELDTRNEVIKMIGGIVSGLLASLIYAIITNTVRFNYKSRAKSLLYELHGHLSLLENGIEYHNEYMIYTSISNIYKISKDILDLNSAIVIGCQKGIIKVINTLAAQCIAVIIFIGQVDRGYGSDTENDVRIDYIKSAFYLSDDYRLFSNFAHRILTLLMDEYDSVIGADDVHILDNCMHIWHWKNINKNIQTCSSNAEIEDIIKKYINRKDKKHEQTSTNI